MKSINERNFDFLAKPFKRVNIEKEVISAIKEHQRDIEDLQREQLSAGLASDGTDFQPGYRPKTIAKKKKKGQPYDRVTLKDTGKFQQNIYARFDKEGIDLSSRSTKTKKLVDKYFGRQGGQVFGLTEENKIYLAYQILPLLEQKIKLAFRL